MIERQLPKLQGLPVTKAVIYRNVDKKAWEQITTEHQGVRVVIIYRCDEPLAKMNEAGERSLLLTHLSGQPYVAVHEFKREQI